MDSLTAASGRLPYPFRLPRASAFSAPADFDTFQSEYIRVFQVGGRAGPPCPLHSGHYTNDRLRTLETLVRYYGFFGVQTQQGMMPDHVSVQLEFMNFLAEREDEATTERDRRSCLLAQRDFLRDHLANWWPRLLRKAEAQQPIAFYRAVVGVTSKFLQTDLSYLTTRAQSS
ncbi:MAG TPA: molecular chaperone TorD family protein [Dehalococcoidia bacterium]|nr:molecular chaperone TorD family protein [Dehalococcoidia bacterium]